MEIATLSIGILGDFRVQRRGVDIVLPRSKKTRALLAYLAVEGRPQRRERLCELFWELPDDPRGSLRWSLSKIRQAVDDGFCKRLVADRETVRLDRDGLDVDLAHVLPIQRNDLSALPTERLQAAAAAFRGRFLDDLPLPRCPEFEAWRVARGEEVELKRLAILRELVDRLCDRPDEALVHARVLLRLNPDDPEIASEIEQLATAARNRARCGARTVPFEADLSVAESPDESRRPRVSQEIRFCTARDGVRLAYAVSGTGLPILRAAHWMTHLEYDLHSPVWRHWIEAYSEANTFVRYDQRCNGLSERGVADISFKSMVDDLEAVADAAGLDQLVLLGLSQGGAYSVAYALRHPERVRGLILYGCYTKGWRRRGDPHEIARRGAMATLIREGWGRNEPVFRQLFTSMFLPGGTSEQMDWYNDLQQHTASPDDAYRLAIAAAEIDVTDLLADLNVPTLVLHAQDDLVAPFEYGKAFAEGISGARFVELSSQNHILLGGEPAFDRLVAESRQFLDEITAASD